MTTRPRLSSLLLDELDRAHAPIERPSAAMRALPERAIQFGTGAFLRGFVDAFLDDANRRGQFNGRVVAVGSTGSARDRAFEEQDGLFTLVVRGQRDRVSVDETRIIGAVSRALTATTEWHQVLAVARDPQVRLVFSNTTEAGLALDERDADQTLAPRSFPAKLTAFLHERASAFEYSASAGMVVLPCELVAGNGDLLSALVRVQAKRWALGTTFTDWLDRHVTFCNTLVDRIVPGTPSADDRDAQAASLGYDDALMTVAEPYALFAIEGDEALAKRLGFADSAGVVRVVPDVRPYRERKLRLLNGTHTAMAALGLLHGSRTVYETMSLPVLGPWLRLFATVHVAPVLDVPEALEFAEQVLQRFANPQVKHRLTDIAAQGTLKWSTRLLPVLQRAMVSRSDRPDDALVVSLAAQLYLAHPTLRRQLDGSGVPSFADDLGERVHAHWLLHDMDDETSARSFVTNVLGDRALWPVDLRQLAGLESALTETLHRLHHDGVQALLSPATVST